MRDKLLGKNSSSISAIMSNWQELQNQNILHVSIIRTLDLGNFFLPRTCLFCKTVFLSKKISAFLGTMQEPSHANKWTNLGLKNFISLLIVSVANPHMPKLPKVEV